MDRFHFAAFQDIGSSPLVAGVIRSLAILSVAALSLAAPSAAEAAAPHVEFDVPLVIPCRDITTDEFSALHPGDRLLEATFEISSLVTHGKEADLVEYVYQFVSPLTAVRVVDYRPRTTLASDYASGINIEKKDEKTKSTGIVVNGAWDHLVQASGNSNLGSKQTDSQRYELVAPMDAVAASGTLLNSQGVYFKLRSSRQSTLEGSKEFTLVFSAPYDWQGSLLRVGCRALGYDRGVVRQLDELTACGQTRLRVVLVGAGDEASRKLGEDFVRAEQQLRMLAAASREDLYRHNYPTVLHEIGGLLDVVKPKITDAWLEQLLRDPQSAANEATHRKLPAKLRLAAEEYIAAHQRLDQIIR